MKLTLKYDTNGNKVLKISPTNGRGFSIQTNGNLPETDRMTRDTLDAKTALREAALYVESLGTDRQKQIFKTA